MSPPIVFVEEDIEICKALKRKRKEESKVQGRVIINPI